jgi:hypothetical protein
LLLYLRPKQQAQLFLVYLAHCVFRYRGYQSHLSRHLTPSSTQAASHAHARTHRRCGFKALSTIDHTGQRKRATGTSMASHGIGLL